VVRGIQGIVRTPLTSPINRPAQAPHGGDWLATVKREYTVERCKYDEFKGILGEFSDGISVTIIDFYILASL
jgi:hypothetical protein